MNLSVLYLLVCFTDFVPDISIRFLIGYVQMFIFGAWLAFHVRILLASTYQIVKEKYKTRFKTREKKVAKRLAKINKRNELRRDKNPKKLDGKALARQELLDEDCPQGLAAVHAEAYENANKNRKSTEKPKKEK